LNRASAAFSSWLHRNTNELNLVFALANREVITSLSKSKTLVDWVQADETTVNRRAMEALEHCRCYWYSSGVGSNYSRRTVENT
jgi:hypothetical protein